MSHSADLSNDAINKTADLSNHADFGIAKATVDTETLSTRLNMNGKRQNDNDNFTICKRRWHGQAGRSNCDPEISEVTNKDEPEIQFNTVNISTIQVREIDSSLAVVENAQI